ncbi:hypothetical protein C1645_830667 [Glomus cerebriforme]|uniref:Uncharacterized protein n=1 Tax=Glomus cerebriforme TaxID=658196 RepID=A0A397SN77_9GLOM|nr:hypothetical protein C1645_830667 [Glomus cerebriforme]
MLSELKLLKQYITKLEAENVKLRKKNTEIPSLKIKLSVFDAEIAELKQLETRFVMVKQASLPVEEQSYNDNPSEDSTSNFNSVAEYHEKPLVDVKTDSSFSEEKEMDNFLLKVPSVVK